MRTKKLSTKSAIAENLELVPLTDKLYTDFSIEALEERLETAPLLLSGLFDEITPFCVQCKKTTNLTCEGINCITCYQAVYNDVCKCKSVDTDLECYKA